MSAKKLFDLLRISLWAAIIIVAVVLLVRTLVAPDPRYVVVICDRSGSSWFQGNELHCVSQPIRVRP